MDEDRGSGHSRDRGGMKDDHCDRYSEGKRVDLIPLETGKIMTEDTLVCLREIWGLILNGVYSAANYTNGSFGSDFVCAGIQTSFRTDNPTGIYQNIYNSTQQSGSNVANIHNGVHQQAYADPATTAAVPMTCYPRPTRYSQ